MAFIFKASRCTFEQGGAVLIALILVLWFVKNIKHCVCKLNTCEAYFILAFKIYIPIMLRFGWE